MKPRHCSILLALGTLSHAWKAQFSAATECEAMKVEWSGTAAETLGPPFVVRLAALGLAPLTFNVPTSAWDAQTLTGSYTFSMPLPGNTHFVATMDDGYGVGTGGVTGVQTVQYSSFNSSCVPSNITQPEHVFDLYGSFVQCSVLSMNWTQPAASQTRITGLVPNGVAFQLDPPPANAKSTTWDLNIPAGTAFVLMYVPASGPGLTTPLLLSTGDGSNRACLASGAYPSATAAQTGITQATGTPASSSVPSPASTSNPGDTQSSGRKTNLGMILGVTLGVLGFLGALGMGFCFYLRKRRYKRVRARSPGLAKDMNLDLNSSQFGLRSDVHNPLYHHRHPEGAVVLPFVLPSAPHQAENPSSIRKDRPHTRTHPTHQLQETAESESSYTQATSSGQSALAPPTFARGGENNEPVFVQHEDGGSMPLPRAREVIELPPEYHQLSPPAPRPPQPPQPPQQQERRRAGHSPRKHGASR